jgi:hypothetical protein
MFCVVSAFNVCMGEVINTDVIISDNLADESEQREGAVDDNLGFSVSWILGQHCIQTTTAQQCGIRR